MERERRRECGEIDRDRETETNRLTVTETETETNRLTATERQKLTD